MTEKTLIIGAASVQRGGVRERVGTVIGKMGLSEIQGKGNNVLVKSQPCKIRGIEFGESVEVQAGVAKLEKLS